MDDAAFRAEEQRQYRASVRRAAQHTFQTAAFQPADRVYAVLSEELRRRGIDPDPKALYDGAHLISRGRKPSVLRD